MNALQIGEKYDRGDVHQVARDAGLPPGNATAGIVNVGDDLTVFWNPFRRLYANQWIEYPRSFQYSGEGSSGPMSMTGGNARLDDARAQRRLVRLFYKTAPTGSRWLYVGDYVVTETLEGISDGDDGEARTDYRFAFELASSSTEVVYVPTPEPKQPRELTEEELWQLAEKQRAKSKGRRARGDKTHPQKRLANPAVTAYAKARAKQFGGLCELCDTDPGWRTWRAAVHLQVHHLHPNIDLVDWVAAVCGTCHDRLHHSTDRKAMRDELRNKIVERQAERGRPTYSAAEVLLP